MMKRFLELNEFLNPLDKDIAPYISSATEMIIIRDLTSNLEKFESITKNYKKTTLTFSRNAHYLRKYLKSLRTPANNHYLGTDKDSLTHYRDFEVGIVKNISAAPSWKTQKEALKGLLGLQKDNTEETSVDYAESILNAKK